MTMIMRKENGVRPVLLKFGVALAITFAGFLYARVRNKRIMSSSAPPFPPPSNSDANRKVDHGGGLRITDDPQPETESPDSYAENKRLASQVVDYSNVLSELEDSKAKIKLLKGKISLEAQQSKEQNLDLNRRVRTLKDQEHEDDLSGFDGHSELHRINVLEDEVEDLRNLNESLKKENDELARMLGFTQFFANSLLEDPEEEGINKEMLNLREENEHLTKEVERLQGDRHTDSIELDDSTSHGSGHKRHHKKPNIFTKLTKRIMRKQSNKDRVFPIYESHLVDHDIQKRCPSKSPRSNSCYESPKLASSSRNSNDSYSEFQPLSRLDEQDPEDIDKTIRMSGYGSSPSGVRFVLGSKSRNSSLLDGAKSELDKYALALRDAEVLPKMHNKSASYSGGLR